MSRIFEYFFGSFSDHQLKAFKPILKTINERESFFKNQSNEYFLELMNSWKELYKSQNISLETLVVDVFAATREVCFRILKKRLFDSQIIGSYMLHRGFIAEMKTGEGKTLVSAPAVVLNAIVGKHIHIISVNDYLTRRDAEILGPVFKMFGLTTGFVLDSSSAVEKLKSYKCDVTYCSNNQIVFDYLKDNMATSIEDKLLPELYFVIIDEVDNILIDEARTPLIISDSGNENVTLYEIINTCMYDLKKWNHYELDAKQKNVYLTKDGAKIIEEFLIHHNIISGSLYETQNVAIYHIVTNLLKAHKTMEKDCDYVVKNDEIIIIDEFTGRLATGRRFSNGLHQAIEAKEGLNVKPESVTKASMSYTNYFRLYGKISGMTGTASSEQDEFAEIYNLNVVKIPTNKPVIRYDHPDIMLYRTFSKLNKDLLKLIKEKHEKQQPILICTPSVAYSEYISNLLLQENIYHNLLNAKNNEREAYMIAQAGRLGAVTVSTNMAGRGTDIELGGSLTMAVKEVINNNPGLNPEVIEDHLRQQFHKDYEKVKSIGGLCVLIVGTTECEKSEQQFMGRAGRQGDPGESYRLYCLEDNLLRVLSETDAINKAMIDLYFPESKNVHTGSRVLEVVRQVQLTYQSSYFEMRKNLLKYDDVLDLQRRSAYKFRDFIMSVINIKQLTKNILEESIVNIGSIEKFNELTNASIEPIEKFSDLDCIIDINDDTLRYVILRVFDRFWYEQIIDMDNLKKTIHLLSFEQKDPVQEFKNKAYEAFNILMKNFCNTAVIELFSITKQNEDSDEQLCICGSGMPFEFCHKPKFDSFNDNNDELGYLFNQEINKNNTSENNSFADFLSVLSSIKINDLDEDRNNTSEQTLSDFFNEIKKHHSRVHEIDVIESNDQPPQEDISINLEIIPTDSIESIKKSQEKKSKKPNIKEPKIKELKKSNIKEPKIKELKELKQSSKKTSIDKKRIK